MAARAAGSAHIFESWVSCPSSWKAVGDDASDASQGSSMNTEKNNAPFATVRNPNTIGQSLLADLRSVQSTDVLNGR